MPSSAFPMPTNATNANPTISPTTYQVPTLACQSLTPGAFHLQILRQTDCRPGRASDTPGYVRNNVQYDRQYGYKPWAKPGNKSAARCFSRARPPRLSWVSGDRCVAGTKARSTVQAQLNSNGIGTLDPLRCRRGHGPSRYLVRRCPHRKYRLIAR